MIRSPLLEGKINIAKKFIEFCFWQIFSFRVSVEWFLSGRPVWNPTKTEQPSALRKPAFLEHRPDINTLVKGRAAVRQQSGTVGTATGHALAMFLNVLSRQSCQAFICCFVEMTAVKQKNPDRLFCCLHSIQPVVWSCKRPSRKYLRAITLQHWSTHQRKKRPFWLPMSKRHNGSACHALDVAALHWVMCPVYSSGPFPLAHFATFPKWMVLTTKPGRSWSWGCDTGDENPQWTNCQNHASAGITAWSSIH